MNKKQRLMTVISIALLAGSFSACSYIHYPEKKFSEEDLAEKAAEAIGMPVADITVLAKTVQTTDQEISYRVEDNSGNLYRCYFAVFQGMMGYMTSGAGNANCRKIER